jgi:ribonuclease HI
MIEAYVDGSWMDGKVGWGAIIVKDNKIFKELSGVLTEEEVQGTRQVAGELWAVIEVVKWCIKNKINNIKVYYDYTGIKEWVLGTWKAKKEITQNYRDFIRNANIEISWEKVKSHSGNYFNEKVDLLAKSKAK